MCPPERSKNVPSARVIDGSSSMMSTEAIRRYPCREFPTSPARRAVNTGTLHSRRALPRNEQLSSQWLDNHIERCLAKQLAVRLYGPRWVCLDPELTACAIQHARICL